MAIQNIGLGTTADDGTGDTLRVAGDKINDNFAELYERGSHPGFVSGLFYPAQKAAAGANSSALANLHYAIPVYLGRDVTIQALACRVATAAVGNAVMSLYSNANGRPSSLLASTVPIDTNGTAGRTGALTSNYAASAGWHWLTFLCSANVTVAGVGLVDWYIQSMIGGALNDIVGANSTGPSGVTGVATYSGGPPSSFGTPTNLLVAAPFLGFQVA